MNFDDAVRWHVTWKVRLQTYLAGHGEPLLATTIARDDVCDLGCWLHGEGAQLAPMPEYEVLRRDHAAFHEAAGRVVTLHQRGDTAGATHLLEGEFTVGSSRVIAAIGALRRVVQPPFRR